MNTHRIGLLREGKTPPDKRVPFTPRQVEEILQRFPEVSFCVQPSKDRCFRDNEYAEVGAEITDDVSSCDILMGVKEVPVQNLLADKTYLFFSHTIKQQPYNKKLLQEVLAKKIRLIDYETLKDSQGNRLVAFGRYAGIVGAYNALWTYGNRYHAFSLRRAFQCFDVNDLKLELRKVKLPAIKIALTGAGRVGKGAMETLDSAGIRKVSPDDFKERKFEEAVYVQLSSADYHTRTMGGHFNREEFHKHPELYSSRFAEFAEMTDMLIAGAYWNPAAPPLFTRADMLNREFRIKIIADVTCDIDGSIPSTKRASTITEPLYDYDAITDQVVPPLSGPDHVTVMGVDNLPCELPRSASDEFGRDLIDRILKPLLHDDKEEIIKRATIAADGNLTGGYEYLQGYVS
jgi:saccharopine dehydrogenase (NAD+, L-lysine forming)